MQIANPRGGGVLLGTAGLLYVTVPLMWFFIGRELLDQSATVRLTRLVVVLGVVVAAYGLLQSQVVHPVWDRTWVDQVATARGYSSLNVGGTLRSFGTFSSAGEYQLFVGAALAVSWALALSGRAFALLPLPLLGVALFLASGRGALIFTGLAVVVLIGLSTRRPLTALVVVLAATGLAFGASTLYAFGSVGSGQQLDQRPREPSARRGDGPLESEQLDPVDSRSGDRGRDEVEPPASTGPGDRVDERGWRVEGLGDRVRARRSSICRMRSSVWASPADSST